MKSVEDAQSWMGNLVPSITTKEECTTLLQTLHPRYLFIKRLRRNAAVLDVGAGAGTLVKFKDWPFPKRNDLKFYAYSLAKGEYFDEYDGWEISNWESKKPNFDGRKFDAIYASHFIEHIKDPKDFLTWCYAQLNEGGVLYVEWPSEYSDKVPKREELEKIGLKTMIGNYFDDKTHLTLPRWMDFSLILESLGFVSMESGLISIPFLENEVPTHFLNDTGSLFPMQMAFWLKSKWARYFVVMKP